MAEFPVQTYIEAPFARTSTLTRLTDVFPVTPVADRDILAGVTYEQDYCIVDITGAEVDYDNYDDCIRTAAKTFDEGLFFVDSRPLGTIYSALKCRPGFGTGGLAEYEARAERRLTAIETSWLEKQLETWVLAGTNATTVTAGTDLQESVAALVSQNIDNPTLHISVENALLLGDLLQNLTLLGIRVVASPVYSDATAFLTGAVITWGSPVATHSAPDPENNYIMAISERSYQQAVEPAGACKPFKVTLP